MELLTPVSAFIFFICFLLASILFTVKVWQRQDLEQSTKIMWTIFFVLVPVAGIICYLLFGSPRNYTNANN